MNKVRNASKGKIRQENTMELEMRLICKRHIIKSYIEVTGRTQLGLLCSNSQLRSGSMT